jgi:hypothetical protein
VRLASGPPPDPVPDVADVCGSALRGIISDVDVVTWPRPQRFAPVVRRAEQRRRYLYQTAVRYGRADAQLLDVWRRPNLPATPALVMIFVAEARTLKGRNTCLVSLIRK